MLERMKGADIVTSIGGISTLDAAMDLFASKMDDTQLARIKTIKNPDILIKIANSVAMCDPASVWVNTGSEEDRQFCRDLALERGEEKTLAMKNHTIHYDLKEEQGRIVDRTFYIINEGEAVSSLGNKMLRPEATGVVRNAMGGIMKGRPMLIGFFVRGPVGSPVSNPALEITSSAYVMHSANILYRCCFEDFEAQLDKAGHFYTNVHSEGLNRSEDLPNARVFMDRSWWTTYSVFCTYAGNTLLLKKGNHRFTVDKATYLHRGEQLSEHMFITGMNGPGGRITWFAGAAPSGCGKTTTAMAGDWFVGDDLAQMWIEADGTVRSINPECGIFGIVQDVNWEGDPQLMDLLRKEKTEVIWSNVLITDDGVPHWMNNGEPVPEKGVNFQGEWFKGKTDDNGKAIPHSHPNSRCTVSASALATYSEDTENPDGVVTRIITYSGRDSDTMPPLWVAKNSDHGVAIGACIVSAATATEVGATGVKRAPWANAPFIPGALGDYMDAQFRFFNSDKLTDDMRPIMAGLNYFLTEEARGGTGTKLLGEKKDVKVWLSWLERRSHGEIEAIETPIGYLPKYDDLKELFATLIDKEYPRELYDKQFSLYVDKIVSRLDLQIDAYGKEANLPPQLFAVLNEQKQGLLALKGDFGAIITPDKLGA